MSVRFGGLGAMTALRLPSPRRETGLRVATPLWPVDSFMTHRAAQNRDAADARSHCKGLPHCRPKKHHDGQVAEDQNRARGTGLASLASAAIRYRAITP